MSSTTESKTYPETVKSTALENGSYVALTVFALSILHSRRVESLFLADRSADAEDLAILVRVGISELGQELA